MIVLEKLYFDPETESFYNEKEEEVVSIYSEKERKRQRNLDDEIVRSNGGYGRAALIGLAGKGGGIAGGLLGTYAGKNKAIELAREGASDQEILDRSTKHGRRMGAIVGLGTGAIVGAARGGSSKSAVVHSIAGGLVGALGAHIGTKKNVQDRLDKEKALRLRGGRTY